MTASRRAAAVLSLAESYRSGAEIKGGGRRGPQGVSGARREPEALTESVVQELEEGEEKHCRELLKSDRGWVCLYTFMKAGQANEGSSDTMPDVADGEKVTGLLNRIQ